MIDVCRSWAGQLHDFSESYLAKNVSVKVKGEPVLLSVHFVKVKKIILATSFGHSIFCAIFVYGYLGLVLL